MIAILLLALAQAGTGLELILNDPAGRTQPADVCDVRLCTSLVETIDKATKTVDVALYGMRDQSAILNAIKRAKARGVRVRVIVDRDVKGDNYYSSTPDLIAAVGEAHVADDEETDRMKLRNERRDTDYQFRCDRPTGFKGPPQCLVYDLGTECVLSVHSSREPLEFQGDIMHNKFVVVDERWVWTGSTNASNSGTGGYNANLVVLADSPEIAGWYTAEFEQMFTEHKFHDDKVLVRGGMRTKLDDGTAVEVMFSPQDKPMTRGVLPQIQKAKESIDIAVFFLTHKGATEELIKAHQRGVKIRVIIDATAATNGYTKHEILRAAGIPVKVENWGGKMHAKSAVIDGLVLITGSMNWTSAGEGGNDENTMILWNPKLAKTYQAWFDGLWAQIDDTWLEGRPQPESLDSGTACTDGSDNDFDHLRDDDDPSCAENPPAAKPLPPVKVIAKRGEECPKPGADGY